jgi:protein TonB
MARVPAFTMSLALHAAAFAAIVVLPVFGPETLPEVDAPSPPMTYWPAPTPVVLAHPGPRLAAPRAGSAPRRQQNPFTPPAAPVVPTSEPDTLPADEPTLEDAPAADFGGFGGPSMDSGGGDGDGEAGPGGGGDGTGPPGAPIRVGGDIDPPQKLVHVAPTYPELARRARIRDTVVLECTIDVTGQIVDVRVLRGHPLLTPTAVEAVRRWRYTPTRLNSQPVSVLMTVSVRFDLS